MDQAELQCLQWKPCFLGSLGLEVDSSACWLHSTGAWHRYNQLSSRRGHPEAEPEGCW